MTSLDANNILMGGGSKAARFDGAGVSITGTIDDLTAKQQTDFTTGELKSWPNGDPMMQVIARLQTEERENSDDDGLRSVYIKGKSMTDAVRDAVRRSGAKGLELGGTLTVTYTGDGVAKTRGMSPPKLYAAEYAPPNPAAAVNSALGITAPAPVAPAQVAAQPVQTASAAAAPAAPDLSALSPEARALVEKMLAGQAQAS